jgi:nucleoside-diphosphate-sugar epimerase
MRVFVTGGTGFIGRALIQKLIARGDEVRALARSATAAAELHRMGATFVQGDLNDHEALRAGMQGCEVVYHVAGWYKLGARDQGQAERVNVEGTRSVLETAFALGIPRIVYTSTVAVFGDTHGQLVDESYRMPPGQGFLTEYDRTKWKAHYEAALPLIERGAPVIIVQPGAVVGPGDHSLVSMLMRQYRRGLFPILPGPELTLTIAHVDDVAEGHILAAEKGRPGESYILAGPPASLAEMFEIWSRLTGRRPPLFSIPGRYLTPLAPLMGRLGEVLPLPPIFSRDAVAILEASYIASAEKARRELGWQARPLEESFREALAALDEEAPVALLAPEQRRAAGALALAAAGILLSAWLLGRRRR